MKFMSTSVCTCLYKDTQSLSIVLYIKDFHFCLNLLRRISCDVGILCVYVHLHCVHSKWCRRFLSDCNGRISVARQVVGRLEYSVLFARQQRHTISIELAAFQKISSSWAPRRPSLILMRRNGDLSYKDYKHLEKYNS